MNKTITSTRVETMKKEQLSSLAQSNGYKSGYLNIVSFSGGKDSTAMLLMMLEKGMRIDEIIFCDTGKEFPQMYEHIEKVSEYTGQQITTLKSEKSFEYYLGWHVKTKGNNTGGIGYGWPDFQTRWCTLALKRDILSKYYKQMTNTIEYIGIAFDERERATQKSDGRIKKYPLVEWGITENQALRYCYKHGIDWGGLYRKFKRVSCYCCPLQSIPELYIIYNNFSELWGDMKKMDAMSYRKFRNDYSLDELEKRFELKARQTMFSY